MTIIIGQCFKVFGSIVELVSLSNDYRWWRRRQQISFQVLTETPITCLQNFNGLWELDKDTERCMPTIQKRQLCAGFPHNFGQPPYRINSLAYADCITYLDLSSIYASPVLMSPRSLLRCWKYSNSRDCATVEKFVWGWEIKEEKKNNHKKNFFLFCKV